MYILIGLMTGIRRETIPAKPTNYPERVSNPSERWILFYGLCIGYGSIGYYRLRGWI